MAVPLLVGYSGKRGKYALKWLFYTFYPAHLALLGAIYLIIHPDFLSVLFRVKPRHIKERPLGPLPHACKEFAPSSLSFAG